MVPRSLSRYAHNLLCRFPVCRMDVLVPFSKAVLGWRSSIQICACTLNLGGHHAAKPKTYIAGHACSFSSKNVVVSPALFDAAMRVRRATSAVRGPCPAGVSKRSCSEAAATVRWPPCSLRQRGRPVACCRIRWALGTVVPGRAAPSSAGTCSFSRGPADLSSTNC